MLPLMANLSPATVAHLLLGWVPDRTILYFAGGVKNATHRYDLPPPPLAVRNLVRACPDSYIPCMHWSAEV